MKILIRFLKIVKIYGGMTYKDKKEKLGSFVIIFVEIVDSRLGLPYKEGLRKLSVLPHWGREGWVGKEKTCNNVSKVTMCNKWGQA